MNHISRIILVALSLPLSACLLAGVQAPQAPIYPGLPFTAAELIAGEAWTSPFSQGFVDGASAKFSMPSGIAMDANYYYVGDLSNHAVRRIHRLTRVVETMTLAGQFVQPMELMLSDSTLYVADYSAHCIRTIDVADPSFSVVTVLGQCGSSGSSDGVGTAARFKNPGGIVKVGGDLYVADYGNHMIRKVALGSMQVTTIAGDATSAGHVDDVGALALFQSPLGLAHYNDPQDGDVLFITDQNNSAIRRLVLADASVSTIPVAVSFPWGLTTDGENLYVGDMGNFTIRKVRLSDYDTSVLLSSYNGAPDVFGSLGGATVSSVSSLYFDAQFGLFATSYSTFYRLK